jgi:hypothetical protein
MVAVVPPSVGFPEFDIATPVIVKVLGLVPVTASFNAVLPSSDTTS